MTYLPQSNDSFLLTTSPDGLVIGERNDAVPIHVAVEESAAVRRATRDLAQDLTRVAALRAELTTDAETPRIVVGTLGISPLVDAAVEAGLLDLDPIRDEHGDLRWEGYLISVVEDVLYLVGADRRGTIYAVYSFTEAIGVSPWHWWGDIPVRTRDAIVVRRDAHVADWPSVRYRGVFINDEEELFHWARAHTADGTIGPETYARIFELLLRLKGNYLWPAMHVGAFNHDPENGRLAHEMGVVIGTSHCDMLLRSNEHEFRPWVREQGEDIRYDYSLRGRNRDKLHEYWRGSVEQNGGYEVTWTVGIRGVHDSGFVTQAIDEDPSLSEADKFQARIALLEEAINDQRELLADGLGIAASGAPQLFVPYKEVLPLYDGGLRVPDDVTLVWANDNFGHIRRFPTDAELERSGGHGLYYHSSYWSNYTTSYLATSSTPLALMHSELRKAWDRGIRRLWIDNIGGLKPLEIEMEFFLRNAWEAGRQTTTASVADFTARWIDANFSGCHGARASAIYADYYRLNDQRKIEHLTSDVFPQVGYGDEAGRRLAEFRRLYDETNEILRALPDDERDAFFQLFAVKIHMAYLTNGQFAHADRSTLADRQGRPAAADHHLAISRTFESHRRALIHSYNSVMADGKWNGMFTPESFPPPVMPMHPPATPALRIDPEARSITVTAWGDDGPVPEPEIVFSPHGTSEKWIELATTGLPGFEWSLEADPWIELDAVSGTADAETRVAVRIPDATAAAGRSGTVTVRSGDQRIELRVLVERALELDPGFIGAIESEGVVSLDPSAPDSTSGTDASWWSVVPFLGRDGDGALQARLARAASGKRLPESAASSGGIAEFRFHLATAGAHLLEIHRVPTLDSTGRIRVGVSVDDDRPVIVESPTTDEHRGVWAAAIQDNVEKLRLTLPGLSAGPHTLRVHIVDGDFTISKLIVFTGEPRPTNLGPVFSRHTGRPASMITDPNPGAFDSSALAAVSRDIYRTHPSQVAPLSQLYADRTFWDGETTFRPAHAVAQPRHERHGAVHDARPGKDVLAAFGAGAVTESDGVIALEAEYALAGDESAWNTASTDDLGLAWTHTNAESDAGTGLAMHVRPRGLRWDDARAAPAMHFSIDVSTGGTYRAWLLVKFDDNQDDSCVLAVDGVPQPIEAQFSRGELCTYGARQVWLWAHLSDVDLAPGRRTLSIIARKAGLRIDRVYLTLGDELPPLDADWAPSARLGVPSADRLGVPSADREAVAVPDRAAADLRLA